MHLLLRAFGWEAIVNSGFRYQWLLLLIQTGLLTPNWTRNSSCLFARTLLAQIVAAGSVQISSFKQLDCGYYATVFCIQWAQLWHFNAILPPTTEPIIWPLVIQSKSDPIHHPSKQRPAKISQEDRRTSLRHFNYITVRKFQIQTYLTRLIVKVLASIQGPASQSASRC